MRKGRVPERVRSTLRNGRYAADIATAPGCVGAHHVAWACLIRAARVLSRGPCSHAVRHACKESAVVCVIAVTLDPPVGGPLARTAPLQRSAPVVASVAFFWSMVNTGCRVAPCDTWGSCMLGIRRHFVLSVLVLLGHSVLMVPSLLAVPGPVARTSCATRHAADSTYHLEFRASWGRCGLACRKIPRRVETPRRPIRQTSCSV